MAKDPAILWYFNDWQGGTTTLSRFLKGCYMDLLHAQFNNGHLSLDEIKTVLGSDFGSAWPTLQKKFAKDENGLYYNERLVFESVRRSEYKKSRTNNLKGKQPMGDHMENENRNEIESVIGKKNEIEIRVIDYYNTATGSRARNVESNFKWIRARLNEGITEQELCEIIDYKVVEWTGTDQERYLTIETLFGNKAEKYRTQVQNAKDKGLTASQIKGNQNGSKRLSSDEFRKQTAALYGVGAK